MADAGARLCASGTTASVRSFAHSAATLSHWRFLRAANLRLPSLSRLHSGLRRWRSHRYVYVLLCHMHGTLTSTCETPDTVCADPCVLCVRFRSLLYVFSCVCVCVRVCSCVSAPSVHICTCCVCLCMCELYCS